MSGGIAAFRGPVPGGPAPALPRLPSGRGPAAPTGNPRPREGAAPAQSAAAAAARDPRGAQWAAAAGRSKFERRARRVPRGAAIPGAIPAIPPQDPPVPAARGGRYLPKAGLMKAGWRNTAAPRKVPRPSGVPAGGSAAEPGGGGGRLGKAAAAAAAAVQAESRAG